MRIGIDLDNTIICYDSLFHQVAVEMNWIPATTPKTKTGVKSAVFQAYNNDVWTELQGMVYGPRLDGAQPYPGALEFFHKCRSAGHTTCIISHKTQYPAIGARTDLREAALKWLAAQGWLDESRTGLGPDGVEFADTRAAKVSAIRRRGCEVFIDDLPEVFMESGFPEEASRYLFDPDNFHPSWPAKSRAGSWRELDDLILS